MNKFGIITNGSILVFLCAAVFSLSVWSFTLDNPVPAISREITVVLDKNYPPFCFTDEKGIIHGYLVDEWELWSKISGIRVKLVGMDWSDALTYMKEGKADVIDTIFFNEERKVWLDFTEAYYTIEVPIFFHKNISGITDEASLKGFTIGVKEGDACIDILQEKGITDLRLYKSYEDIVKAAKNGDVRIFCIDKPPALYYMEKYDIEKDFRMSVSLYQGQFHRAVKKGNKDLLAAIEKGFREISAQELGKLDRKWFGTVILANPATKIITYALIVFGVIIINLAVIVLTLRITVRERTLKLNAAIDELKKSENRMRGFIDALPDELFKISSEGTILDHISKNTAANDPLAKIKRSENVTELDVPDSVKKLLNDALTGVFDDGNLRTMSFSIQGDYGSERIYEARIAAAGMDEAVWINRDITDQKMKDYELAAREEQFRTLVHNIPGAVYRCIFDKSWNFVFISEEIERITGYSPADFIEKQVRTYDNVIHPDDVQMVNNSLNNHVKFDSPFVIEYRIIHRDGFIRWISEKAQMVKDTDGRHLWLDGVIFDITREKKMEEELLTTQKIDTLGIFAGGIAHDFNNYLAGILGNISLAKELAPTNSDLYNYLSESENATLRARSLTQRLLTFSKGGTPVKREIALDKLVRESSSFILSGSSIKCEYDLEPDVPKILLDEGQINQVIHNLVLNAMQAMDGTGIITIRLAMEEMGNGNRLEIPPGKYIRLEIKDQGKGISTELLPRIFDPFFTTKTTGTGLGLTTSYSIVRNHGGFIFVDTEIEKGTSFIIYLPVVKNPEVESVESKNGTSQFFKGSGRVLLLDDEDLILTIEANILRKFGFVVDVSHDGEECLEKFKESLKEGDPYSMIFMDLTIPGGKGGKETIKDIRELSTTVKTIVSSGYSDDPIMANFRDYGFDGVLPKPYNLKELSELLYRLFST